MRARDRRRFLQGAGAAGIGVVAGCLGTDEPTDADASNGDDAADATDADGGQPTFEVSALEPGDTVVTQGESVIASATIENTGEADGTQAVALRLGTAVDRSVERTLDAGASETVAFDLDTAHLTLGEHSYRVETADDEATAALTIEAPSDVLTVPWGLNAGGAPPEPASDVPVAIDGLEFVSEADPTAIEGVTVTHGEIPDEFDWFEPPAGTFETDQSIEGTDHDALYQTEFHGPDLGFEIALANGTYDVTLHFAEIVEWVTTPEHRVFDVSVQGERVVEGLDLFADVGSYTAWTVTVEDVAVTDHLLTISSTTHEDVTKYSAIEIREA